MTTGPAIRPLAGERWLGAAAPVGRISRTMACVAGASLLGHLAVVGTVGVAGRAVVAQPREIAVELVQDVPKPAPKAEPEAAKVESSKPEKQAKLESSKPERPKPEAAKPDFAKPEATKPDLAKPEATKTEPAKAEATKPEPAKPEVTKVAKAAKAEPHPGPKSEPHPAPKAERKIAVAPKAPPPAREAAAESRLAALRHELDSLKAEQAQLEAEHVAERGPDLAPTQAALHDTGLGLLPNSFQAVALPSTTDGPGEAASYEAIVFSALAKAKGIGPRQGVPGTAGVRFSLDAAGKLVAVELIQWSGIPNLDSEALALVRRAAFPPPPQGAQRTFVANVNFESRRR